MPRLCEGEQRPSVLFETERLLVRRATRDDLPALLAVFGAPENTRYFGPERPLTREEVVERYVDAYPAGDPRLLSLPGLVALKPDLEPIGFGGVGCYAAGSARADLFFVLAQPYWGRGLATELARAAVARAFAGQQIGTIYATAKPVNVASLRVLEKCDFRFVRYLPEGDRNEYRLDRT